eukprot:TRINITY_DN25876_c0_g1_i4.p2 TRINITY_DN25876_c0_g1~~TRINITY_DN25876_c0_g1_i4.p2  ORF type:complete len:325 (-),score=44.39 TRINITY_DN25876_c0_g1_i4:1216-2190(-)
MTQVFDKTCSLCGQSQNPIKIKRGWMSSSSQPALFGTNIKKPLQKRRKLKCVNQTVENNWREFRAKLVLKQENQNEVCDNFNSPNLRWAHPLSHLEKGCVLLATPHCSSYQDEHYWQSVVLLLSQDPEGGSMGLVLNKPSALVIGKEAERSLCRAFQSTERVVNQSLEESEFQSMPDKKMKMGDHTSQRKTTVGVVNEILQVLTPEECDVFHDNRIFCGGFSNPGEIYILHGCEELSDVSFEICPGVYVGNSDAIFYAMELVKKGDLNCSQIFFFSGLQKWGRGQLEFELGLGFWKVAACSENLILSSQPQRLYNNINSLLNVL